MAGQGKRVVWTMRERVVPRGWVIDAQGEGEGGGTITYVLTLHLDEGTTFERDFVYAMLNLFLAVLDRLVLHRRVEAEPAKALRRLKDVLERRAA